MKILVLGLMMMLPLPECFSQPETGKKLSGQYSPTELVTISKNASFDEAVETLNSVSQYNTGKSIISAVSIKSPIGVDLDRMPYKMALNVLVNLMNLRYEEEESRIIILRKAVKTEAADNGEKEVKKVNNDVFADTDAREVNISAVFFDADVQKTKERGIDWKAILSHKNVSFGGNLLTKSVAPASSASTTATPAGFGATAESQFSNGDFSGNLTALFRFFEEQSLGEIIASPSITVRDGQKGRIQIGSDFSIKQRDFSGNIIDKFYSAGSIIEVVPYIYNKKDILYSLLKISVERSSFFPGEITTEVKKTAALSDVLLLNGEQTVIGGLFVNEETIVRNGIPFLKDLPWWVLGIRYLTGSDQTVTRKKEVVIMIKADILPTLEERYQITKSGGEELLKQKLKDYEKDIIKYKPNNSSGN